MLNTHFESSHLFPNVIEPYFLFGVASLNEGLLGLDQDLFPGVWINTGYLSMVNGVNMLAENNLVFAIF